MAIHYIFLGSSYKTGKRIALDISSEDKIDEIKVNDTHEYLKENCIMNSISIHVIPTESVDFASVKKYDKYFANVSLISTKEEFADLINLDRNLNGLDVAKYILSRVSCTHLKIQKLTYFCYADYLCKTNKKLFVDTIYAYEKGPIVKGLYDRYKKTKGELREDNKSKYSNENIYFPIRSRILVAENGIEMLASIDETIDKYGNMSANELVALTHKEDSPWSHSGAGKEQYKLIEDEMILKYHINEEI
ncbi:MAG: DUF4065 domain-containing protein [Bacilli bacterium]|nr:DUF4065 domain-containing protein [Bacilli bacterium]